QDFFQPVLICTVFVVVGAITRWALGPRAIYSNSVFFKIPVFASLVFIVIGSGLALNLSGGQRTPPFPRLMRDLWLGLHGCIFGLLFVLLP
ncbi:MAG: hypothetical protein ACTHMA_04800, partial [Thermomicrobiales bacterium]